MYERECDCHEPDRMYDGTCGNCGKMIADEDSETEGFENQQYNREEMK